MGERTTINSVKEVAPASIQLIWVMAQELGHLYPRLKDSGITLTESSLAHPDEAVARCLQLLVLAALSMHGGVFIPSLTKLEYSETELVLYWAGGAKDHLTWGKLDVPFNRFLKYAQKQIWRKPFSEKMTLSLVRECLVKMVQNSQILTICTERIEALLRNDLEVLSQLGESTPSDFIFILISSLPPSQLNHLFLYLCPFFPEDLVVKTTEGNQVNVTTLFDSPSQDVRFLIEKAKIYLKLYDATDLPVVRIITQMKTTAYLKEALRKEAVLKAVQSNLSAIREAQIVTRLKVYWLLSDLLNQLIKA